MPAILQRSVRCKMSTDKDSTKSEETKVEEDVKDEKLDNTDGEEKDVSENEEKEKETPKKKTSKAKEVKKEEKSEEEEEDEEEEDDEDDDEGDEKDDDGKVPLLDQPLQLSGTRERKKVQRFTEEFKSEPKDAVVIEIPEGKGASLGDIPRIEAILQRYKSDDLKALHRVLFNRVGKSTMIKKNLRKFNGFDFDKNSDQFDKKKHTVQKLEVRVLKSLCGILDLEKKGNREEIAERIVTFLVEPKDSGKPVPAPRPKRSSAVKANNKGYSESEDDEKRPARSRRGKSKRANLKDDSDSDSEKEQKSKKKAKDSDKEEKESDDEADEDDSAGSSDEDEPKSKKKRGKAANNKKAASKKASTKKTPNKKPEKKAPKKRKSSAKSDEDGDESSSEDEPLSKKTKNPPTDDEIKTFVKEILEGANLEEITMKTVCKQVYAHYPEFDLAHKKDFIKTTVKSLIST